SHGRKRRRERGGIATVVGAADWGGGAAVDCADKDGDSQASDMVFAITGAGLGSAGGLRVQFAGARGPGWKLAGIAGPAGVGLREVKDQVQGMVEERLATMKAAKVVT